ncbi:MAG: hypothetical protein JRJ43_00080 [Deltaproteobacteria bacterium]|nr:hypothetical protein [Deltaproteobacteria bacterium]MBW2349572.1 hypothetical protein [Deltaproteobacteria bacterium]
MDQTKIIPDPEDFARNVESTIDELFSASRQIEIDPLTSEVRELSQVKTDQGQSSQVVGKEEKSPDGIKLSDTIEMEAPAEQIENTIDKKISELGSGREPDFEEKETEEVNLEQQFSQLNQLLLTLEWEVTQTQAVSAKNMVELIRESPKIGADKNLHELLNLMISLLEGIADHPEKMPTSGPEVLQRGLDTFKNLVWNEGQDPKAKEELFRFAKKELESAIDMDVPEVAHEVPEEAVLERLIEDVDDLEPGFEDEVRKTSQKEKFSDQQEQINDSILEADIQEKAAAIESEFLEHSVLVSVVKSHIKILDDCISYILPVEKLLAQTQGMEKLHHFQQNIKDRIEEQKKILEKALTGDYDPSSGVRDYAAQRAEDITIEIDKEETPSVRISCPWHELVIGQWDQKQVAFVPEDVAFAGTAPRWTKKGLNKLKTFKLKKLKAWPWTKIQPLMQGKLSNQKESQLIKLEFPVLQKSISSSSHSQPSDNPTVLVLFREDKGLVLMLETTLKTISVTPECSWEPSAKNNGQWVGNLRIEDKQISVATLESLLNTLTNE